MSLTDKDWESLFELQSRLFIDQVGKMALLTQLFGMGAKKGLPATLRIIPGNRDYFIELNHLVRNLQEFSIGVGFKMRWQFLRWVLLNSCSSLALNSSAV